MELNEFLQLYNQKSAKTGKHPKVKVSKEWYEKQLQSTFVLRNNDEQTLIGIPVEFDDSVNTFKFEYEE